MPPLAYACPTQLACGQLADISSLARDGEHPNGRGCLHSLKAAPDSSHTTKVRCRMEQGQKNQGTRLSPFCWWTQWTDIPCLGKIGSQSASIPAHLCQTQGLGFPQSELRLPRLHTGKGLEEGGRHPGLATIQACDLLGRAARPPEGTTRAPKCTRSENRRKHNYTRVRPSGEEEGSDR